MAQNVVEYILDIRTQAAERGLDRIADSLDDVNKELKETQRETKKSSNGFDAVKKRALGASVAIGAMAAAAFKAVTSVVDLVNNLNDLSVRSGLATDTIQALEQAMKASGQPAEGLNEILNAMAGQFAQLTKEGSEVEKKFKSFGIAVRNSNGDLRSNNDILLDVINQLQGISDNSVRSRRAVFLLGESGAKLNQALASGEFNDFLNFTREFGVKTGKEASQAAAQFQSSLSALSVVTNGTIQQYLKLTGLQELFLSAIVETGAALAFAKSIMESFNNVFSTLFKAYIDFIFTSKSLIAIIGDLVDFFGLKLPSSIQTTVDFIENKLTNAFSGVSSAIVGPFSKAIDFVIDKLSAFLSTVFNILNEISKSIGIDFISGFNQIQIAFEKATESANNYRESALKVPDLKSTTDTTINGFKNVENQIEKTTEKIRTLDDVINDFTGKVIPFDINRVLQDTNIVLSAIEKLGLSSADKIGGYIQKVGFAAADTVFEFLFRLQSLGFDKLAVSINKLANPLTKLTDKFSFGMQKAIKSISGKLGSIGGKLGSIAGKSMGNAAMVAIAAIVKVIGIASKLGQKARSEQEIIEMQNQRRKEGKQVFRTVEEVQRSDIEKNIEEDIRARAKAIELGLQVLPNILIRVLPPLFVEFVDRIVFGFFKSVAELTRIVIDNFKKIFTREGRQELKDDIKEGAVARFNEFIDRINILGGILSKRGGGRFLPSARGGIKFTGMQDQGLAMLHRGEFVVPETGQMPQAVQRTMGMGGGNITINVNAAVVESNAIDELVKQIERRFQTFGSATSPLFGGR